MNLRFALKLAAMLTIVATLMLAGCATENFSPLPANPPVLNPAPASQSSPPASASTPGLINPAPSMPAVFSQSAYAQAGNFPEPPPDLGTTFFRAILRTVSLERSLVTTTNVTLCGTNRFTHQEFCITNPVFNVPPSSMTLAWMVPNWPTPVAMSLTNHILWSTNSPAGPWAGDIAVPVTNNVMYASVRLNRNIPFAFFKLGGVQ